MTKRIRRGLYALLVCIVAAGATMVGIKPAAATNTPQQDVVVAAYTVAVQDGLNATAYNCLVAQNNQALNEKPASMTEHRFANDLIKLDQHVSSTPGDMCSNGGIDTGKALTPNAVENPV